MKNVLNDSFDQPNCESGEVLTIAVAVNKEHRTTTTFTLSSSTTSLRKEVGASIVLLLHSISNDNFQKFGKAIFYSQVFWYTFCWRVLIIIIDPNLKLFQT